MNKIYGMITDQIIAKLEGGTIPWQKTWASIQPQNGSSGRPYRGINVMLLQMAGKESPYWFTYKQAKALGGHVNEGAKSSMVIFWKPSKYGTGEFEDDGVNEIEKTSLILRYYRVFNLEDVTLPDHILDSFKAPDRETSSIEEADRIIKMWHTRPPLKHHDGDAFYMPGLDEIRIPRQPNFKSDDHYYTTKFHEYIHSTAHKSRLDRFIENRDFTRFAYDMEELIAEIGASYLNGISGIENDEVMENSAAYIRGWLRKFQDDKKMIVIAALRAQKAVDYIMNGGEEPVIGVDFAKLGTKDWTATTPAGGIIDGPDKEKDD